MQLPTEITETVSGGLLDRDPNMDSMCAAFILASMSGSFHLKIKKEETRHFILLK